MKKLLRVIFITLLFTSNIFADETNKDQEFYFKNCKSNTGADLNYYLDINKMIVHMKWTEANGTQGQATRKIKSIEPNKIITDIKVMQNQKHMYTQFTFDASTNKLINQWFVKSKDKIEAMPSNRFEQFCNDVKDDWNEVLIAEKEKKKPKTVAKKPGKKITKSADVDNSLITIGSGSGFYINNKGYALTNNHVIDICAQSVAVIDGKETLFRVIATDKTNDVAVLKTDYKSRNYIKINEDGAKLGENVIAVGYPLAGRLSDSVKITRGIVSSLSGLDNNIGQIQIDAALQPGNSGGPVLNENGELVGIASAGLNKLLMAKEAKYIPENVNFAVASPIIVNILKSKKVKYTSPSMFSGSYSNTELAELGDSSTIQLFCRNTRTAYNRLKSSDKYSTVLLDLD
jgi:S1-C subfamily serine protease